MSAGHLDTSGPLANPNRTRWTDLPSRPGSTTTTGTDDTNSDGSGSSSR